jgi:hypothetical protein
MQDTAATKNKPLIIREELTPDEQQTLMQDLLTMVIVVNLMVLLSIILCA